MILATKSGKDNCVQFLVENGANVHMKDIFGNTALCYAKTPRSVEILLQGGAEISTVDMVAQLFDNFLRLRKEKPHYINHAMCLLIA